MELFAIYRGIKKIDRYKFDSFRRQMKAQPNKKRKTLPDRPGWLEPKKLVYTATRKIINQTIAKQ